MAKVKRVGFLGGTFDPIHFGHLQLALCAKEYFGFDTILFCPANLSPFKLHKQPIAAAQHRLAMVQLATQEIEGFLVYEQEVYRQGPSFTIETLNHLQAAEPLTSFHLILGEDQLEGFHRWKDVQEILTHFHPVVGSRFSKVFKETTLGLESKDFFCMNNLEISSTYLRHRLSNRLYCKHLMPPKVVDYILEHKLYLTH